MSEKQLINIKPDTRELRAVFTSLKELDKDANTRLKDRVQAISAWTALEIKRAAYVAPMPDQAVKVAASIRANRDRVPNVTIGGSKGPKFSGTRGKKSKNVPTGVVLFGSEFGAKQWVSTGARGGQGFDNGGRRFPDRSPKKGQGNAGYWIFPTLVAIQPEITRRWIAEIDKILKGW